MLGTHCPECGEFVEGEGAEAGDVIECDNCGCELEVVSLNPFKAFMLTEEK